MSYVGVKSLQTYRPPLLTLTSLLPLKQQNFSPLNMDGHPRSLSLQLSIRRSGSFPMA